MITESDMRALCLLLFGAGVAAGIILLGLVLIVLCLRFNYY